MKKILTIIILVVALQLGVVSLASASGGGYGGNYHTVHYGETLHSIGRHYDVNPYHIAEVNGLYNPNHIYAGQVLYIPQGSRYPWQAYYGRGHHDGYYGGYDGHKYGGYDGYDGYHRTPARCNYGCGRYYGGGYSYYGYDYTGYYYGHGKNRYSHTCGYNYNCW